MVDPNGLFTGIGVGSGTAQAFQDGVAAVAPFTVTAATLTSIAITPNPITIANGTSIQLTATGTFSDGSTEDLTKSVSWAAAPKVRAVVDPNGLFTGTGVGSGTAQAFQDGVAAVAPFTVM